MTSIRTSIMSRKVQWSITRCAQCSYTASTCGQPCTSRCRRISVLVKGRLYSRWLCQHCIERIWGTVSPSTTLLSRLCGQSSQAEKREEGQEAAAPLPTAIDQPFKRGAALGSALLARGILDFLDLTNAQGCHALASRYAECAYPHANREDQQVLVAGLLHAWVTARARGEGMR